MKDSLVRSFLTLGLMAGVATVAANAQPPTQGPVGRPPPRPTISPYLNLLRSGSPAINYYGLVRPQQEYNAAIRDLQMQTSSNRRGISDIEREMGMPETGHSTSFFNYSHFYSFSSGAGSSGSAPMRGGIASTGLGQIRNLGSTSTIGGSRGASSPSPSSSKPAPRR